MGPLGDVWLIVFDFRIFETDGCECSQLEKFSALAELLFRAQILVDLDDALVIRLLGLLLFRFLSRLNRNNLRLLRITNCLLCIFLFRWIMLITSFLLLNLGLRVVRPRSTCI